MASSEWLTKYCSSSSSSSSSSSKLLHSLIVQQTKCYGYNVRNRKLVSLLTTLATVQPNQEVFVFEGWSLVWKLVFSRKIITVYGKCSYRGATACTLIQWGIREEMEQARRWSLNTETFKFIQHLLTRSF